ncbi:MAG TPA: hypothetical protein VIL05_08220 [Thermoclostridium sp.]
MGVIGIIWAMEIGTEEINEDPFIVVRSISDNAVNYDEFEKTAA